jgi:hypothetical protein
MSVEPAAAAGRGREADPDPAEAYRARREASAREERRQERISLRFSVARGAAFVGFLACLFLILVNAADPGRSAPAGAGMALVAFVVLVVLHDRQIAVERRCGELKTINQEALDRLERAWDRLPLPSPPATMVGELPPLARDLDLFGRASLFHLLGTVHTPGGKGVLREWLLAPGTPGALFAQTPASSAARPPAQPHEPAGEIAARQEAVGELASEVDLRQGLELVVRPLEKNPADCEAFLRWAEDRPWLLARPWLVWLTRVLPVVTLGLVAAAIFTPLPAGYALAALMANFALSNRFGAGLQETFDRLSARQREFIRYAEAMRQIGERTFASRRLQEIAARLSSQGQPADRWMDLLDRRVVLADARRSGPLNLVLQSLFLWNFHTLFLLELWQRDAGRHARGWLAALGEFEALCALAGLRFDNPGWCFPAVAEGEPELAARLLGHPLLPATRRVGNDVVVGPAGTFLLVTGSNMSGKSTLLRALGINVVLAQAGGPVCAESLRLPPFVLATSILVQDSLAEGISFFMAELLRVRQVVEAADRCRAAGRPLLYLLDEVLRGTNSQERRIAIDRVLRHLLAAGALGTISTHDLALADLPSLHSACRPVHFRETLHPAATPGAPLMTFDYKLRPGLATTANALHLLRLVGLDLEE